MMGHMKLIKNTKNNLNKKNQNLKKKYKGQIRRKVNQTPIYWKKSKPQIKTTYLYQQKANQITQAIKKLSII